MYTFTSQKSATISRQSYTGSPAKSSFSTVSTPSCYLRPLTEEQSALNAIQYGLGFSAIFEIGVDVKEGDIVTIDSVPYTVRGVVKHDRGFRAQYIKAVMFKPEKS